MSKPKSALEKTLTALLASTLSTLFTGWLAMTVGSAAGYHRLGYWWWVVAIAVVSGAVAPGVANGLHSYDRSRG